MIREQPQITQATRVESTVTQWRINLQSTTVGVTNVPVSINRELTCSGVNLSAVITERKETLARDRHIKVVTRKINITLIELLSDVVQSNPTTRDIIGN